MSTDTTADSVATRLAEIEARAEGAAKDHPPFSLGWTSESAADVPFLLAAFKAARKLAGEWDEAAAAGDASAAAAAERGADWTRTSEMAARAQARRECAQALRGRIGAALLGEGDH